MRNVYDVVDQMVPLIPREESALLGELHSLKQSALFAAPEATRMWWTEFHWIINEYIPPPGSQLTKWQTNVVNIFMDKA